MFENKIIYLIKEKNILFDNITYSRLTKENSNYKIRVRSLNRLGASNTTLFNDVPEIVTNLENFSLYDVWPFSVNTKFHYDTVKQPVNFYVKPNTNVEEFIYKINTLYCVVTYKVLRKSFSHDNSNIFIEYIFSIQDTKINNHFSVLMITRYMYEEDTNRIRNIFPYNKIHTKKFFKHIKSYLLESVYFACPSPFCMKITGRVLLFYKNQGTTYLKRMKHTEILTYIKNLNTIVDIGFENLKYLDCLPYSLKLNLDVDILQFKPFIDSDFTIIQNYNWKYTKDVSASELEKKILTGLLLRVKTQDTNISNSFYLCVRSPDIVFPKFANAVDFLCTIKNKFYFYLKSYKHKFYLENVRSKITESYFTDIEPKIEFLFLNLNLVKYLHCVIDTVYCNRLIIYTICLYCLQVTAKISVQMNKILVNCLDHKDLRFKNVFEKFIGFHCHKNGSILDYNITHEYICPQTLLLKKIKSCYGFLDFAYTHKCFTKYKNANFLWDISFFCGFFSELYKDSINLANQNATSYELTFFYPDSYLQIPK
ncbi:hypothetical protein COBT_001540 [Conglomerata obtusa]